MLDSGGIGDGGLVSTTSGFAGSRAMEQREFERAITAPNFLAAFEAIKSAEGEAVIDAAATSGSVLMLRFLFGAPAWMRPRHMPHLIFLASVCLTERVT